MTPRPLPVPPPEMRALTGLTDEAFYDNPGGGLVLPEIESDPAAYDRILDLGCGCGRVARQLIQQHPRPSRYVGIDLHRGMVGWCQAQLAPAAADSASTTTTSSAPASTPGERRDGPPPGRRPRVQHGAGLVGLHAPHAESDRALNPRGARPGVTRRTRLDPLDLVLLRQDGLPDDSGSAERALHQRARPRARWASFTARGCATSSRPSA